MKINRFLVACRIITLALLCVVTLSLGADDAKENAEKRTQIQKMANDTLARLYKADPAARAAVQKGYGYAVFSNTGVKILFGGSGNGKGMAVNNQTKQQTYMKMFEIQAGLGFGVKKFSVIFVFDNAESLQQLRELRLGIRRPGLRRCQDLS